MGVFPLRVEEEKHRALRADVAVSGGVPSHEQLIVPKAKLAAPQIATSFVLGASLECLDLHCRAVLREPSRLRRDQFCALIPRLPRSPPGAFKSHAFARRA